MDAYIRVPLRLLPPLPHGGPHVLPVFVPQISEVRAGDFDLEVRHRAVGEELLRRFRLYFLAGSAFRVIRFRGGQTRNRSKWRRGDEHRQRKAKPEQSQFNDCHSGLMVEPTHRRRKVFRCYFPAAGKASMNFTMARTSW